MPVSEDIYIKDKPKRKLTQAQLDGLAKGRAKVKEKREEAKNNDKVVKENTKRNKQTRAKMNRTIAEQKELELEKKLETEHKQKIDEFNTIKYKYMDRCKTLAEMREMKSILDTIEEEEIYDLKKVGKKIINQINLKYNNNNAQRNERHDEQVLQYTEQRGQEGGGEGGQEGGEEGNE